MLKWFEYALAVAAVVVLLVATPLYAFNATTSCGNLDTAGEYYQLQNNVDSNPAGTCFTVTAANVTLDCVGHQIIYASLVTGGYGVYSPVFNTTIENCVIVEGSTLINSHGVFFNTVAASNGSVYNTIIGTSGAGSNGVYSSLANNLFIQNTSITTTGASSRAVYFDSSSNNSFFNSSFNGVTNDFYGVSSPSNNFTNCSFNKTKVTLLTSSYINVFWYASVHTIYSLNGSNVGLVNVNISNVNGTSIVNLTTNMSGWSSTVIQEYMQNATGIYNMTPHWFNATKFGFDENNTVQSITSDSLPVITLTLNPPPHLTVNCFDEETGNSIECDSVTVNNATNSSIQYAAHSFTFYYPTGNTSIEAANASFYTRVYPFSWNASYNDTVNAYLLNASTTAIFVRFHVSNAFSQPISNASILIQRFINGSNVVVASLITDSFGLTNDYFELGHSYNVLVYATGFNVYVSTISPVVNDYYITLTSTSNTSIPVYQTYGLNNTFVDAYWNLEPNTHSLSNETTNIVFSVFSPGSTLHYFGMQVDYANGTNICFENMTNSSAGGVVSCLVYMDNATYGTNVSVTVWISKSPPWVSDFIFWFKQTASTSVNTLSDFYQGMRTTAAGADSTAMAFIVIVVATIAGLWVYQYHKTGAMLVMLAILWLGAVEQFLNVNLLGFNVNGVYLMAFITVAVVSINFLKERV
jgi:hypothetical protein